MSDYFDKYKTLPFESTLSRYRRERACEFIATKEYDLWVEVGCGTQPLPNIVQRHRWIVIEPVSQFRELVSYKNTSVYSAIEDIAPVTERCGIIIDSLLHELPNPVDLLRSYRAVFKNPDNLIRINVPNALSFHRQVAQKIGLIDALHDVSPTGRYLQQERVYTPTTLQDDLRNAGLRVLEISSSFPKIFTNAQMQAMLDYRIVNESLFLGMSELDSSLGLSGAELVAVCKWQ